MFTTFKQIRKELGLGYRLKRLFIRILLRFI